MSIKTIYLFLFKLPIYQQFHKFFILNIASTNHTICIYYAFKNLLISTQISKTMLCSTKSNITHTHFHTEISNKKSLKKNGYLFVWRLADYQLRIYWFIRKVIYKKIGYLRELFGLLISLTRNCYKSCQGHGRELSIRSCPFRFENLHTIGSDGRGCIAAQ